MSAGNLSYQRKAAAVDALAGCCQILYRNKIVQSSAPIRRARAAPACPTQNHFGAIGQSLESLGIVAFVMEKNGRSCDRKAQRPAAGDRESEDRSSAEQVLKLSSPSGRRASLLPWYDGSILCDPTRHFVARCPRAKEAAQAFVGSDNRNLARITIAAYPGRSI